MILRVLARCCLYLCARVRAGLCPLQYATFQFIKMSCCSFSFRHSFLFLRNDWTILYVNVALFVYNIYMIHQENKYESRCLENAFNAHNPTSVNIHYHYRRKCSLGQLNRVTISAFAPVIVGACLETILQLDRALVGKER